MIRLAVAASLERPIGLVPVCVELNIPRSTVYAQRVRAPIFGTVSVESDQADTTNHHRHMRR